MTPLLHTRPFIPLVVLAAAGLALAGCDDDRHVSYRRHGDDYYDKYVHHDSGRTWRDSDWDDDWDDGRASVSFRVIRSTVHHRAWRPDRYCERPVRRPRGWHPGRDRWDSRDRPSRHRPYPHRRQRHWD